MRGSEADNVRAAQQRAATEEQTCWVSFWGNILLAMFKLCIGLLGYCSLLVVDGLHSASNALVGATTLYGLRVSREPKDAEYPYGYGKAMFVLLALTGILIALGAIAILLVSLHSFRWQAYTASVYSLGLLAAGISALANQLMYRYLSETAKAFNSAALRHNAWNNRLNVFSSLVVVLSLTAVMLGLDVMDELGAIGIAALLLGRSVGICQWAVDGCMDRGLPESTDDRLRRLTASVPGVEGISAVRARQVGQKVGVDLTIQVSPSRTVAEADEIATHVEEAVARRIGRVEYVAVEFNAGRGS
jgi:cation diffusion facilitator family transporter